MSGAGLAAAGTLRTLRWRAFSLAAAVAAVMALSALAAFCSVAIVSYAAAEPGPVQVTACQLMQNGHFELASDISYSGPLNYCMMLGSNTVLDCMGRRIYNNGTSESLIAVDTLAPGSENITVRNCVIENFQTAVRIWSGRNVLIQGNTITGGSVAPLVGIDIGASGNLTIEDNVFMNYTDNIKAELPMKYDYFAVRNNTFYGGDMIEQADTGSMLNGTHVIGNTFYSGRFLVKKLFNTRYGTSNENLVFSGNRIYANFSGVPLYFMNPKNLTIEGNVFGDVSALIYSAFAGNEIIHVIDGKDVTVRGNEFRLGTNMGGVETRPSGLSGYLNDTLIENNSVFFYTNENTYGLTCGSDSCLAMNRVSGCVMRNNTIIAPQDDMSGRHTMMVKDCLGCDIYSNTVIGGLWGVVFKTNNRTRFHDNRIENSTYTLFHDKGSQNSLIYSNEFRGGSNDATIIYAYNIPGGNISNVINETYMDLNLSSNHPGFTGTALFMNGNASISLVNVTYGSETLSPYNKNNEYVRSWWYQACTGNAGDVITIQDMLVGSSINLTTDPSGCTGRHALEEYTNRDGARSYKQNYSATFRQASVGHNMTVEHNVFDNITADSSASPGCSGSNRTITYTNRTCFNPDTPNEHCEETNETLVIETCEYGCDQGVCQEPPCTGMEGDVSPRETNGDCDLKANDLAQMRRFVAGLDSISSQEEFQRADCAPYSSRGDGEIKASDLSQMRRYVAGLDPFQESGGPTNLSLPLSARQKTPVQAKVSMHDTGDGAVEVVAEANGTEQVIVFSISYSPSALHLDSAVPVSGSLKLYNNIDNDAGRASFIMEMPSGSALPPGRSVLARLNFSMAPKKARPGIFTAKVGFSDGAARMSASDGMARDLNVSFSGPSVIRFGGKAEAGKPWQAYLSGFWRFLQNLKNRT